VLEFGNNFLNILFLVLIDLSIPCVIQGLEVKRFSLQVIGHKGACLSQVLLNNEEAFAILVLTSVLAKSNSIFDKLSFKSARKSFIQKFFRQRFNFTLVFWKQLLF